MVVHTYNSIDGEAETKRPMVPASLGYLANNNKKNKQINNKNQQKNKMRLDRRNNTLDPPSGL